MSGDLPLVGWECAVCGQPNECPVDPALGSRQQFTEDCRVCCRPNFVKIRVISEEDMAVEVSFDE